MAEECKINHTVLRLVKGDITEMETDALVYYAQSDLVLGSGFGTAIAAKAGRSIQEDLKSLSPVGVGDAVVTAAGNMKAKHVIHAVGPKFQEEDTESKLRATMSNALAKANESGSKSVVFPPMGAGFYGVPLPLCARVMIDSIRSHLEGESGLEEVVVCVLDSGEYDVFKASFAGLN